MQKDEAKKLLSILMLLIIIGVDALFIALFWEVFLGKLMTIRINFEFFAQAFAFIIYLFILAWPIIKFVLTGLVIAAVVFVWLWILGEYDKQHQGKN